MVSKLPAAGLVQPESVYQFSVPETYSLPTPFAIAEPPAGLALPIDASVVPV